MQTQSALQDAKQRAISLLKEKSDWMKQKREWEKEQTTLAETKRKLVTAKVCGQILVTCL